MMAETEEGVPLKAKEKSSSIVDISNDVSSTKESLRAQMAQSTEELRQFHDNIELSWQDINVFAPVKKKGCGPGRLRKKKQELIPPKQILSDNCGVVKPGTLLAVLGASGAGKTTLLNVLTRRNISKLSVKGSVRVNGQNLGSGITSVSAYVQQMDLFLGTLKVKEHLWFCAQLRMDQSSSKEERESRVEAVINELGLKKCANTVIGTPGKTKGISGGERKRLAFASELLTDPALLFCDEPTSGLDSFMALGVVKSLKALAGRGKTVVCTIHQPASEVYENFDEILLMAEGRMAYMGSREGSKPFFASVNLECPADHNPADFYIRTLAVIPNEEDVCREKIKTVCDTFTASDQYHTIKNRVKQIQHSSGKTEDIESLDEDLDLSNRSRYRASWTQQFKAVFWRSMIVNLREPMITRARILQALVSALITGLIFLRQPYNQKGIMNINGAYFIMLIQVSYTNMIAVLNTFPLEYPVYLRDHTNGMYRALVYFLCKSVAEIPIYVLTPFLYTIIMYWMVGFYNTLPAFLVCSLAIIMATNVATSIGYILSISAADVTLALALAPVVVIPLMMFGGFFLNSGNVPIYFIWLEYLSWFKYGQEILVVNQWRHITNISCEYASTGTLADAITNITTTLSPQVTNMANTPCFTNGMQVIESLSFSTDNVPRNFVVMLILMLAFRCVSFGLLLLRSRAKK